MGILVIADSAGIGCAGWVLRTMIAEIAELLTQDEHSELASWLTDDNSPVQLFSHLDVRDLTPENQSAFLAAIGPAYRRSVERGPAGWHDPAFWPAYIKLFSSLAEQAELLAKGHTPTAWPNLSAISPHSGQRNGPGWTDGSGNV